MEVVWGNKDLEEGGKSMDSKDLVDFFNESLFVANLKSTTKEDALSELADLFVEKKIVRKKDIMLEMLTKRETLGSTGIGHGVAIPHGRTTAALDVQIAFGKAPKGIDFDSIDGKPVHLIFVVIAPPQDENNRYLPVLGKLVEVVNETTSRKKLLDAKTFQDFIKVIGGEA
jgi:mannitol/fructose-specific phosphotransferase system IIA component (Ntr-type)